jgi:multiple antibiotic resistance protein
MSSDTGELVGKLLPLLFNLMGPIGLMPMFAGLARGMSEADRKAMALRAVLLAAAALAIAVFLGMRVLESWGIERASLVIAGGLVLTLSALQPLFFPAARGGGPPDGATARDLAVSPLAFPGIAAPKAIAVIIIFATFLDQPAQQLAIAGAVAFILLLNYGAMRTADWFMAKIGMAPLQVLGAVFGVLQVALGVQMIADGFGFHGQSG